MGIVVRFFRGLGVIRSGGVEIYVCVLWRRFGVDVSRVVGGHKGKVGFAWVLWDLLCRGMVGAG